MSNLIPITRIYDIYPKYTYSNDVKKFMDEIVDIDRANVFTEADMVATLNKISAEIEEVELNITYKENYKVGGTWGLRKALEIIDKYRNEVSELKEGEKE